MKEISVQNLNIEKQDRVKQNKINILIIRFDNEIDRNEIIYFRGAIIAQIEKKQGVLFHNHIGDKFRYSYPLIQYKRINKKACILCIEEGVNEIGMLFNEAINTIRIGERETALTIQKVQPSQCVVQLWDSSFHYNMRGWLPLNQHNYDEYQQLDTAEEKNLFLERMLRGNILSMAKGIGLYFDQEVNCTILYQENIRKVFYKKIKMYCLDVQFQSNVSLPDFIGLGKGSSLGFGIVTRIRDNKHE